MLQNHDKDEVSEFEKNTGLGKHYINLFCDNKEVLTFTKKLRNVSQDVKKTHEIAAHLHTDQTLSQLSKLDTKIDDLQRTFGYKTDNYAGLVPDDSNKVPDIIRRAEGNEPAIRLSLQYKKAIE